MYSAKAGRVCVLVAIGLLCGCSGPQDKAKSETRAPEPVKPATPVFGTFSIDPPNGTGREQVFRLTLTRNAGAAAPALVGLLINEGAAGTDACYVFAEAPSGRMLLVNDSGVGSKELGKAASVSNGQCDLLTAQTNVATTESAVTATFNLRFHSTFKGSKKLFAIAQDATGATPGLQSLGGQWVIQ